MHRFFLPNLQKPILGAEEAHHALHVLRLKAGDTVNVFDGRGHEAQALISQISNQSAELKLLTQSDVAPLPCRITLAQAIPKKSMDLIVQKATELGVATIIPLISDHTVVKIDEDSKRLDRWREIALDACKQCGNNWLPEIQSPQKARDFLGALPKSDLKLIASLQPDAKPLKSILSEAAFVVGRKPSPTRRASDLPGAQPSRGGAGSEETPAEGSGPTTSTHLSILVLIG